MKRIFLIISVFIFLLLIEDSALAVDCKEGGVCIGGTPVIEYYDTNIHRLGIYCTKCNTRLSLTESAHSFPSTYTSYDSTYHHKKCRSCSYEDSQKHNMKYTITKQPSCIEEGEKTYRCTLGCGYSYTESIAKTPHNWGDIYTSAGTEGCYNICLICKTQNNVSAHIISSSNDWYENYTNTHHYRICSRCNDSVGFEEHEYVYTTVVEATCESKGSREVSCTKCAYNNTESIDKLEHSWGIYVANGALGHRKKCTNCDTYTSTESHVYSGEWVPTITSPSFSHCHRCSVCNYEKDIQVHDMVVIWTGTVDGKQQHKLGCSLCEYEETEENCTYKVEVTKEVSCTSPGNKRYTCVICEQYYDEELAQLSHQWSEWDVTQTQHWKHCTYDCGTKTELGNHIDESPSDGRCDRCNYLMHIAPRATISSDVSVKEGEKAVFTVDLTQGTEPLTYQWYYKTSESGNGNIVDGANLSTLTVTTTKEMDGRLYYCVITNPLDNYTTEAANLKVYYPFAVEIQPQEVNLKQKEEETFKVEIISHGNPTEYTYQWYVASSENGAGTKIVGATQDTYTVKPDKNINAEYYYCVVNNTQYDIVSNRAKLTAGVTIPVIEMGNFNQNIYINKLETLIVPFIVKDSGNKYVEDNNNFEENDIQVLVNGNRNDEVSKVLEYKGSTGNEYFYELTLKNITGDGKLSFYIEEGAIEDKNHNKNVAESYKTNVEIDNTLPTISIEEVVGKRYINAEDTLKINLSVFDVGGYDKEEFKIEDIIIKVGSNELDSSTTKKLEYKSEEDGEYFYELILSNVKGDGELNFIIDAGKIKDLANNYNIKVDFTGTDGGSFVVDNTKPIISSIITTLGGFNNATRIYPTSLEERHDGWANESVYVQIDATDENGILYYMKSEGNKNSFREINSNQEEIFEPINNYVYYRVMDEAGNYEDRIVDASGNYKDACELIKIDKDKPKKPEISMFEERNNGAYYTYDSGSSSDKSIYVIPNASTVADNGDIQSGIETDAQYTYYTITHYADSAKTEIIQKLPNHAWNQGELLDEYGYYEIKMVVTDIAGNVNESDVFMVSIDKKVENTIKISNINDIGSGVKKVTINVYKSNASGGKTTNKAIDTIKIDNPYKEVIKNVRLGEGTFYVEVILEDNVGLTTKMESKIVNDL